MDSPRIHLSVFTLFTRQSKYISLQANAQDGSNSHSNHPMRPIHGHRSGGEAGTEARSRRYISHSSAHSKVTKVAHFHTTNTTYTVQHIILSPESAIADLPALLDSSLPRPASSPRPVAVVNGSAYTEQEFLRMRSAVSEQSLEGVFWLRADMAKMAGMPPSGAGPAYEQKMTMRAKEALMKLEVEGRLGTAEAGEVVLY